MDLTEAIHRIPSPKAIISISIQSAHITLVVLCEELHIGQWHATNEEGEVGKEFTPALRLSPWLQDPQVALNLSVDKAF